MYGILLLIRAGVVHVVGSMAVGVVVVVVGIVGEGGVFPFSCSFLFFEFYDQWC